MMRGISLALAVVLGLALLMAPASTVLAQEGEVVAEGFNGPQGVLVAPDGSIWVVDSGVGGDTAIQMVDPATGQISEAMMGETSRVVQILPDGTQNEVATLPSVAVGQDLIGGARLALMNGKLYVTSGEWHEQQGDKTEELMAAVVEIGEDGTVTPVADTWRSERRMNPDGAQRHSHPYGMAAGPDGKLWVTDAGGNSLLKVGPDAGFIETIAAFAPMPGVFPNPNRGGEMLTDPVPTGITFDADGNAYMFAAERRSVRARLGQGHEGEPDGQRERVCNRSDHADGHCGWPGRQPVCRAVWPVHGPGSDAGQRSDRAGDGGRGLDAGGGRACRSRRRSTSMRRVTRL